MSQKRWKWTIDTASMSLMIDSMEMIGMEIVVAVAVVVVVVVIVVVAAAATVLDCNNNIVEVVVDNPSTPLMMDMMMEMTSTKQD